MKILDFKFRVFYTYSNLAQEPRVWCFGAGVYLNGAKSQGEHSRIDRQDPAGEAIQAPREGIGHRGGSPVAS